MTPGTLAALAEDNTRDYLRRLTREQRSSSQLHTQHLQLQARILCGLYDIDDNAFEASQIRLILMRRQAREKDCLERLDAANAELDSLLPALRQAQERFASDLEQHKDPAVHAGEQQLQSLLQRRNDTVTTYQELFDECTGKLLGYRQNSLYTYLRLHQYGTGQYRRNALSRRMDDWLARQCNFLRNQQNEQLLLAILEQHAEMLAGFDEQAEALKKQLAALHHRAAPRSSHHPLAQEVETRARQVIATRQQLREVHEDIDMLEQCADGDSQDALRWLKYELTTETLNEALAQWAAIGVQQAVNFQQELDELRRRLDIHSQRCEQARQLHELAQTFESTLIMHLHRDARCPDDCTCACHTKANLDSCPCQMRFAQATRWREDGNYRQLIASYMGSAMPLNATLDAIDALRTTTLSDRPLMQGQP
ncbi:hypothetical protein [Pseudomonas sp. UFMG81]|uniref:hypothetical protein n=1 Tax=Pseudomonas sp. UFMG81 TaxID=2745936 RepID=UPI00188E117B|nr:hypothetical protein [Pseudomonas sp. UFMG81]